jgi:aminomethyltransferase
VRERAGIFDVSHLGKLLVSGPGAAAFLHTQLTNKMADLQRGRARYTLICNEDGGILDDLIVYGVDEQEFLVVPNAANRDAVFERLAAAAPSGLKVEILEWSTLAVQGPRSREIVEALYPASKGLGYMRVAREGDVVVSRSGYTGEVGYEVFTTDAAAPESWDRLLAAVRDVGGEPAGLAARDTLRLEMGYPLHGNDISEERTPLEAGLMWAVSLDKGEFRGREALLRRREAGAPSRLWGLRMKDRPIPRPHYPVLAGGERVGETTSGTFSPTLKIGIALAYLEPPDRFSEGDEVEVDVRGRPGRAEVVRPPFVGSSPR